MTNIFPLEYEPLLDPTAQIRLLDLQPGVFPQQPKCHLRVIDIKDLKNCSYEPLSYCWGREIGVFDGVTVNGSQGRIGSNLHAALTRLRDQATVRTLWVDALCINQRDLQEKSAQIRLMRQIYENGTQTIVWLGEGDQSYGKAFEIIGFLAKYAESHPGQSVDATQWDEYRRNKLEDVGKEVHPRKFRTNFQRMRAARHLQALFDIAWLERVWVIQEVAVSENVLVHWGKYSIGWEEIEKAYRATSPYLDYNGVLEVLIMQRVAYRSSRDPKSLASIMCFAAMAKATEPRDKIYALLGLVDIGAQSGLVSVDYNMPVSELYESFTRNYLKEFKVPAILCHSKGCQGQDAMPSWTFMPSSTLTDIPHNSFYAWDPNDIYNSRRPDFRCTGASTSLPIFKDGGKLLGLEGFRVDVVKTAATIMPRHSKWSTFVCGLNIEEWGTYLEWRAVAGVDDNESSYRGSPESVADALRSVIWSALLRNPTEEHHRAIKRCEDFIFSSFGHVTASGSGRLTGPWTRARTFFINYSHGLGFTKLDTSDLPFDFMPCANRRLIKTESGYLGAAPKNAAVGDVVMLVSGSPAPFVMRPVRDSRYKIVGDCYVHGIMNGEIWDEGQCSTIWIE